MDVLNQDKNMSLGFVLHFSRQGSGEHRGDILASGQEERPYLLSRPIMGVYCQKENEATTC